MTVLTALNKRSSRSSSRIVSSGRIYWDYQPDRGRALLHAQRGRADGQRLERRQHRRRAAPAGPYAFTTVPITLDHNDSNSYIAYDLNQTRTAYNLQRFFFEPKLEEPMRTINQTIVALFTAANFPTYTLFTGTGTIAGQVMRADITRAWGNLAASGVPMEDYNNVPSA